MGRISPRRIQLPQHKAYVTYGAEGFFPGCRSSAALDTNIGGLLTKGDLPTPNWYNEFVTGGSGGYGGPHGMLRMWAYLALLHGAQTFLAWTFNTHQRGEGQAHLARSIMTKRLCTNTRGSQPWRARVCAAGNQLDGRKWTAVLPEGGFANLRANPELMSVSFAVASARYFCFTYAQSGAASGAELSVKLARQREEQPKAPLERLAVAALLPSALS